MYIFPITVQINVNMHSFVCFACINATYTRAI